MMDMARGPNLDRHVFLRVLKPVDPIRCPPSFSQGPTESSPGDEESLQEGKTYIVQYSAVRHLFMDPEHDEKVALV